MNYAYMKEGKGIQSSREVGILGRRGQRGIKYKQVERERRDTRGVQYAWSILVLLRRVLSVKYS